MEMTKEYIAKLTKEEKDKLAKQLLDVGFDPDYVNYLVYGVDFRDVKIEVSSAN